MQTIVRIPDVCVERASSECAFRMCAVLFLVVHSKVHGLPNGPLATRQSLLGKGISEPPFLPGNEQIDGEGVIDEPMKNQQHLDGPPPRRPEPAKRRWRERKSKGAQKEGAITRKQASRPRCFRMILGFSQVFLARSRGRTQSKPITFPDFNSFILPCLEDVGHAQGPNSPRFQATLDVGELVLGAGVTSTRAQGVNVEQPWPH
jgi:hypothetical protein